MSLHPMVRSSTIIEWAIILQVSVWISRLWVHNTWRHVLSLCNFFLVDIYECAIWRNMLFYINISYLKFTLFFFSLVQWLFYIYELILLLFFVLLLCNWMKNKIIEKEMKLFYLFYRNIRMTTWRGMNPVFQKTQYGKIFAVQLICPWWLIM